MANNPFLEPWQYHALPNGQNPFLEPFAPVVLSRGANPFLETTPSNPPVVAPMPAIPAVLPVDETSAFQAEAPSAPASTKIDLQKHRARPQPTNFGENIVENEIIAPPIAATPAPNSVGHPFSVNGKWILGFGLFAVAVAAVWWLIKPDPLADGEAAAQKFCACHISQNEQSIKDGREFLRTFDGQRFKTRQEAMAKLDNPGSRATFDACQNDAQSFYDKKKAQYTAHSDKEAKFEQAFGQRSGFCEAANNSEVRRVNDDIEAKLAGLAEPNRPTFNAESIRYVGQVGGEQVDMTLTESNQEIGCTGGGMTYSGSYFYTKRGNQWQISLKGYNCAGNFQLDEFFNGKKTGHFDGQENQNNTVLGTWKSDSKQLPFSLREVSADYVNPAPASVSTLFSKKESLRVRATPDLNGEIVAALALGEQVSFSGEQTNFQTVVQLAEGNCSGPWLKVVTAAGKTGWVHKCGLGDQRPSQPAQQNYQAPSTAGSTRAVIFDEDGYTNVRNGPSDQSSVVTRIGRDQEFTVVTTSGSWWQVRLDNGQSGYMHCSRVWLKSGFPGRWPLTSQRFLAKSDLAGLNSEQLRLMRNEVFARYGYIFKSDDLRQHFSGQNWYSSKYENVDDRMNAIEKENVKFIKRFE